LRVSATNQRNLQDAGAAVAGPQTVVATRLASVLATPERGRLVDLAQWLAGCQRESIPTEPSRVRLVLVAPAGSTASPRIAARADALNIALRDVSIDADTNAAVEAGIALADAEADEAADLILLALPGFSTAGTLALASACAEVEPSKIVERGAPATDPRTWMAHLAEIRDRRFQLSESNHDPQRMLRLAGDPALAFATGLLVQAAARRTPVVLDGTRALTAALVAASVVEDASGWWVASDLSAESAARLGADRLDLLRVLNLDAASGDGTSALLSVPILREAVAVPQTEPRDADAAEPA
jgi:NaMN:DMB phosphoribosyltransferase